MRFLNSTMLSRRPAAFNDSCPTVTVVTDAGPVIINKSDYDADPNKFTLATKQVNTNQPPAAPVTGEQQPPAAPAASQPANDDPGTINETGNDLSKIQFGVLQKGSKFYVVDAAKEGEKIDGVDGIDVKGYASNADAWNAIVPVQQRIKASAPA